MTNLKSILNTLATLCLFVFTANVISAQTLSNAEDNSDGISIKGTNISFYNSSNQYQAGLDATTLGLNFKSSRTDVSNLKFYSSDDALLGGFQFRQYANAEYPFQGGLLDANGQFFLRHQTGYKTDFMTRDANKVAIHMSVFNDGRVTIGNIGKKSPMIQKVGGGVYDPADGFYDTNSIDISPNDYRLFVEKGILTEKVKIAGLTTADWADYVFEEDYEMLPIEELEDYVTENKHLPNVPSAQEVAENGLDLAKTDATLLEKIEESYLYIIELNKKFEALEAENNNLKSDIKTLQSSQN